MATWTLSSRLAKGLKTRTHHTAADTSGLAGEKSWLRSKWICGEERLRVREAGGWGGGGWGGGVGCGFWVGWGSWWGGVGCFQPFWTPKAANHQSFGL